MPSTWLPDPLPPQQRISSLDCICNSDSYLRPSVNLFPSIQSCLPLIKVFSCCCYYFLLLFHPCDKLSVEPSGFDILYVWGRDACQKDVEHVSGRKVIPWWFPRRGTELYESYLVFCFIAFLVATLSCRHFYTPFLMTLKHHPKGTVCGQNAVERG